MEYAHALFVNQPPEGGPGLSDAELAAIGRAVGLADTPFTACVSGAPYLDWPQQCDRLHAVAERAVAAPI